MNKSKLHSIGDFAKAKFYNQADMANQIGTSRAHVTKWKRLGYVVIGGVLCKEVSDALIHDGKAYQKMRVLVNKKGEAVK
tara:strand:+ start:1117 stop:1356 length:240 start_codon:yes stop_codon:yes gene_type:complete